MMPELNPEFDYTDTPERLETTALTCTCPCIDCIEGNHCGGEFWWPPDVDEETGQEPQMVGKCEYLPSEWFDEEDRWIEQDNDDFDDYED